MKYTDVVGDYIIVDSNTKGVVNLTAINAGGDEAVHLQFERETALKMSQHIISHFLLRDS